MSKNQIASLASKLLGIYFVVHSLGYISALGMQFSLGNPATISENMPFMLTLSLSCFFLVLGVGLLMVFRAERAAVFLVGAEGSRSDMPAVSSSSIQMIAYTAVGLLLTIQTAPHFVNMLLNVLFSLAGWSYRQAISGRTYIDLFTSALQVALGIWLLLGARGLASVLGRMRGDSEV